MVIAYIISLSTCIKLLLLGMDSFYCYNMGESQHTDNYILYNSIIENSRVSKSGCFSIGWGEGWLTEKGHEGNF